MKTSKTHRRLGLTSRRILGVTTVLVLGAFIFGSGLAEGGIGGQTTGGLDDKTKDKGTTGTTGTPPPTVVSGGGTAGTAGGVTTGTSAGAPTGGPGAGGGISPAAAQGAGGAGTTGAQTPLIINTGNQPGTQTNPNPQLPIAPASEVAKILSTHKFTGAHDFPLFGYSNFESARTGVAARQASINNPTYLNSLNPTIGPVGPTVLGTASINNPTPERYQLGPGDSFTMRVASPTQEAVSHDMVVDSLGSVTVPETGDKVVVRGQTLAQLEGTLKTAVRRGLRDATVTLQLKELRSMTVYIFGESFAPGTYQMPSIMSLFNAIYMSGGPNENGSMRRIQLRRTNGTIHEYDLYKLMVDGDRNQDVPLQPGDVITILHAGDRISLGGEVTQPAIYELKKGETFHDLLHWGSGIKPSGVGQKISIEKTVSGTERQLIDVDSVINDKQNNPVLHDGDDVTVYSIRKELVNEVIIEGPVDQPHHYGLKNGMTVADLIDMSRGLLPEAYGERADLFRRNDDDTHKLIRIDLQKALKRDPSANLVLKEDDRLVIYRQDAIQWMGDRKVEVKGAVNKGGTFYRADNLSVRDILLQAGGLAPAAYPQLAFLQRTNLDGTVGPLFKINLMKAQANDPQHNIVFQDRDVLTIFTVQEASFIADQTVSIKGAVQKPGTFPLSPGMTARDAILLSGSLLPTANVTAAFIQRTNLDGTPGPLITFNLMKALQGLPSDNPTLFSKDQISVYTKDQQDFRPKQVVNIIGAVQTPNEYVLSEGMRVHDLLYLAGKTLPTATTERAFLQRLNLDGTFGEMKIINIDKVLMLDPANDIELKPGDKLNVYTKDQQDFRPKQVVNIIGAVQTPNEYVLSEGMRVHDLLYLAGKTLPTATTERAFLQRLNLDGTFGEMKIINIDKVLMLDPANDIELKPGDKLNVYTKDQVAYRPVQTVTISGAVQKPASYPRAEGMTLQDLLRLAGGPTPRASDRLEIAKARVPQGTLIQRFALQDMMGPAGNNIKIEDGDIVAIPEDARIMEAPMMVTIAGNVANPGPYLVSSTHEHLSSLLRRAGGLLPEGFAKGASFLRKPEFLTTDAQTRLAPRVLDVLSKVQADEYKRAVARSEVDKMRAIADASKQGQPSVNLSATGSPVPTTSNPTAGANQLGSLPAVTPARPLLPADLAPGGNLNISIENALRHPGGSDDVILRDGDTIFIPQTPVSITLSGAVIAPSAVKFEPGKSLAYYINRAGGFTNDAAKDQIIVIRTSGNLLKASMSTRLELGDTIFIPTKVEVDHLHDKSSDFTNSLAQITNAGLLIAVVHALVK